MSLFGDVCDTVKRVFVNNDNDTPMGIPAPISLEEFIEKVKTKNPVLADKLIDALQRGGTIFTMNETGGHDDSVEK